MRYNWHWRPNNYKQKAAAPPPTRRPATWLHPSQPMLDSGHTLRDIHHNTSFNFLDFLAMYLHLYLSRIENIFFSLLPGLLHVYFCLFQMLEERDRKHRSLKDQLNREHRYLKRRLDSLTKGQYRIRVERSISECSSSTVSTTSAASEPGLSPSISLL